VRLSIRPSQRDCEHREQNNDDGDDDGGFRWHGFSPTNIARAKDVDGIRRPL
jgi:hypothetical protein